MMTDLIDRLRQRAAAEKGEAPLMTAVPNYMLHREAADCIADLKVALSEVLGLLDPIYDLHTPESRTTYYKAKSLLDRN